jgi:iron complex transport system substrate-binding protein|nr:ABC transporter substrate-binding protein [uncultured Acetatifactor sp.]
MGGDTVTLPETIERVVSTSDSCTDMLVAFGQGDKLIGAYFRALDNPWFKEFCPGFDNIFSLDSYEPEAEALIEMNTDIIFVPSRERAVALREKGICALTIRYYNPDEVVAAAEMLGQIFGGTARTKSEAWIKNFNTVREDMSDRLSGIAEIDKPVAYEILADKGRGPFRTYYGDNQAWLSYAGGILATKDYADATSQAMPTEEAILATNPDIIFIGGTYATKEYADLLDNEMWENVTAVENGNIFIEPTGATAWNTCSTNYPLLIYYCFSCMYPDKVDFDMKEMAHDFYLEYYEIDFSDEQLELMFRSKAPDGTELWTE